MDDYNEKDLEALRVFIDKFGVNSQEDIPFFLLGKKEVAHMFISSKHQKCFVLIQNIGYFSLDISGKIEREIYQEVATNIELLISA